MADEPVMCESVSVDLELLIGSTNRLVEPMGRLKKFCFRQFRGMQFRLGIIRRAYASLKSDAVGIRIAAPDPRWLQNVQLIRWSGILSDKRLQKHVIADHSVGERRTGVARDQPQQ